MYGSVSKWSISYFAAGLFWLLAAEWLMTSGFGFPATALRSPDTLVLVHIVCIGWLSMTMCGALFQFVPVLVARPLHAERWTLLAFILLSAGLIALLGGFLVLGGRLRASILLLPAGATLLMTGFALVAANIGMTLWRARPLVGPARFVAVGLAGLCTTAAFGGLFAFALAGLTDSAASSDLLLSGVPIHAIAGLGGWLTLTAMGVSYRLLAMFMLAPDIEDAQSQAGLLAGAAGVAVVVLVGCAMIISSGQLRFVLLLASLFGLAAVVFYGRDVMALYRSRKRRELELHTHMAVWSFVSLAAAALLGAALVATGSFTRHVAAFVFLAAFGWLTGLVLAMLYKIVAFLTWLETYGPVMGRTVTPRVQDLVDEGRARKWFVLFFGAAWGATLALLCETPLAFRVMTAALAISTVGIVAELVRARRLADVAAAVRVPAGVSVPRLLLSRTSE
jgi:hypothetical protein